MLLGVAAVLAIPVAGTAVARAQTPPGTEIDNTALGRYSVGGIGDLVVASNRLRIVTVELNTPAVIEMFQYAPARPDAQMISFAPTFYSTDGTRTGWFDALPPPVPPVRSRSLDLSEPLPLRPATWSTRGTRCSCGSPISTRTAILENPRHDPRRNPRGLAGETMWLRLTETGPDAGVFTGYVQSSGEVAARSFDSLLNVSPHLEVAASYVDPDDPDDRTSARALVDPGGLVFDTLDGRPVDGVRLTLVNTVTGQPAVVFGDDGQSVCPPTVTSGEPVTDESGRTYDFGPGRYRFPFVPPGAYRLEVESPVRRIHLAHAATAAELAAPSRRPFRRPRPRPRGARTSTSIRRPALQIDLPVDPIPTTDQLVADQGGRPRPGGPRGFPAVHPRPREPGRGHGPADGHHRPPASGLPLPLRFRGPRRNRTHRTGRVGRRPGVDLRDRRPAPQRPDAGPVRGRSGRGGAHLARR